LSRHLKPFTEQYLQHSSDQLLSEDSKHKADIVYTVLNARPLIVLA